MRKFMRRIVLPAFAAALLSLVACVPEFDHPLSDEKTSKIDPQLLGRWEAIEDNKDTGAEKGKKTYWFFSRREGTANTIDYREETLPAASGSGGKPVTKKTNLFGIVFTTKIGSERYISFGGVKDDQDDTTGKAKGNKNKEKAYGIYRYKISKEGILMVYLMDIDVLGQDVAAKKIHGIVDNTEKKRYFPYDVRITAKPREIAEYLKANGDKCFDDEIAIKLKHVSEPAKGK